MSDKNNIVEFANKLPTELKLEWFYRTKITIAHFIWEGYSGGDVNVAIARVCNMEAGDTVGENITSILGTESFKLMVHGMLILNDSQRDHFYRKFWPFSIIYRPKPDDFYKK